MLRIFMAFCCATALSALAEEPVRLKELGRIDGSRENHLVGFGIVAGLAGTGDSPRSKATRQAVSNMLSNFDVSVSNDQVNSRNVAIVSVMASLPPVTRRGDRVDVVVTSMGDARSLVGGTLLLAPLRGPDGKIYALAQGPISVGGYSYDVNGNVAQKNHPTAGTIPNGAHVEIEVLMPPVKPDGVVDFVLASPDMTTARRVATEVNQQLRQSVATVTDSRVVRIAVPAQQRGDPSAFLAWLENLSVEPDARAVVVINERTGTIVSGGDVRISKVTIAHGDLRISIVTDFVVSQPSLLVRPGSDVRTAVVPNTRIDVQEKGSGPVELGQHSTVGDLVTALTRVKANTRDVIAILQGIKAAGALHADLVIQ